MSQVEPNRDCPACGESQANLVAWLPARAFCGANSTYRADWAEILEIAQDASFPLVRCRRCRFVFAGWLPTEEFLSKVYDRVIDEEQGRLLSHAPGWVARQYEILSVVLAEAGRRWELGEREISALDLGCAYGTQLVGLRQAAFRVLGVDASERIRRHVSALGVRIVRSLEEAQGGAPFDVVLLNEVLEHLPDFLGALRKAHGLMTDGGLAWVSVPDFSEWRLRSAIESLGHGPLSNRELNPWEHLNYFTPERLREVLLDAGFRPVPVPRTLSLGSNRASGWRQPRAQIRILKELARWLVRGPAMRTELLVEKIS